MIKKIQIAHLVLCFVLVSTVISTTASPTWVGTNYIQSGFKVIVLGGATQSGTNIYTYTYSPAFSSTPYTALGLIGMEAMNLLEEIIKFAINIPNYTSTTSLQIRMNTPTTSWRQFRASFIAIDALFNQVRVDYFSTSNPPNVGVGTGVRSYIGIFNFNIPAVNIANKISIIPLLIGLNSQSITGEHVFYWDTKLRNANSINYNITADRATRIYSLVSYILVIDRTSAQNGLQIFMDQLYIGGTNNSPVYQTPVYMNITNMHAGLNSGSFMLSAFNFDKNGFVLTTTGYYKFLNISAWSYRQRQCPVPQPYYQVKMNLCYDTCPSGYVNSNGPTKKYCKYCGDIFTACLTCTANGASCLTCAGNYVVSGGSCSCPIGYYVSSTTTNYTLKCQVCDISCLTCSGPTSNNCLSCGSYRTLNGTSCPCNYGAGPNGACFMSACSDQACIQCSSSPSLCQNCTSGFMLHGARCICGVGNYYDLATVACLSCHYSCQYCNGPQSTKCTYCDKDTQFRYLSTNNQCLCIQGYNQINQTCVFNSSSSSCNQPGYTVDQNSGICVQICGDGNRITVQCDDGNNDDGDGCSSTCQIQAGFVCVQNVLAPNKRSFCSYTQPIGLVLNSTLKDLYDNVVYMNFTMNPTFSYILNNYPDLSLNFAFNNSIISTKQAYYNPSTGFLQVSASFTQGVQSLPLTVSFSMPQNALSFAIPLSYNSMIIAPQNKLTANYNSQQTFSALNIYKTIAKVVYIAGLLTFLLLIFSRKMIGIQYIVMLQLSYFAIMLSDYGHSFIGPLQQWQFINGYNGINTKIESAKTVDSQFWILGYKDYFFVNVNVMLFACLANYVLALIMYALSMLSDRSASRKLKTSAIFFAVDIGFGLVVFSLNNISVSLALQALAGHMFSFTYGLDKFFVILAILMFCGQMGAYIYKIHDVNDSLLFYHRNKNYTHYYPFIFIVRTLTVIIFIIMSKFMPKVAPSIVLGVQGAYIISIFAGRPFKRYIDYARMLIVQLTLLLVFVCHMVQTNFVEDFGSISASINSFMEISSVAILIGMAIGLIISWASFGWHLWKGKPAAASILPQVQAQVDVQIDIPHDLSKSQQKFRQSIRQEQKSKQLLVFDVEDEQNTGANTQYLSQSVYNQTSRRKLRSKKLPRNESRQFE